jgi:C_GCAxxG_C_C family probable redox protein
MMLAVGGHLVANLEPQCVQMTTGLSGGVGSTRQELCGALSGGVLVIGRLLGRSRLEEGDEQAITLARRYRDRFLGEWGETKCEALRREVESPGGLGSCAELVERAARILLGLLAETDGEGPRGIHS